MRMQVPRGGKDVCLWVLSGYPNLLHKSTFSFFDFVYVC